MRGPALAAASWTEEMIEKTEMGRTAVAGDACDTPDLKTRVTKSLLGYGVLAGPLYMISVVTQGITRAGFNFTHDDASLLSNGSLGWIQIATFVIAGLMVIASAVGLARSLSGGRASTWGAPLLGLYGLGLIAAGIFVADPMNGFPPGTAGGKPLTVSPHGALHIVAAGVGFVCLITACFVFARRFAAQDRRGWAWYSRVTGIIFLGGFVGVASGSTSVAVVLAFWVAVVLAWSWIAGLALYQYRNVSRTPSVTGSPSTSDTPVSA
jgi:Protein of unknown function (DUF998)